MVVIVSVSIIHRTTPQVGTQQPWEITGSSVFPLSLYRARAVILGELETCYTSTGICI